MTSSTPDLNAPFYATLGAICYLVTVGAVLAALHYNTEALGVGAAVTGLIGIARLPSRTPLPVTPVTPDQPDTKTT